MAITLAPDTNDFFCLDIFFNRGKEQNIDK